MFQRFRRRDPLLRIKRQAPIQQVSKESQFLSFCLSKTLRRRHEARPQIAGWFRKRKSLDGVLRKRQILVRHSFYSEVDGRGHVMLGVLWGPWIEAEGGEVT